MFRLARVLRYKERLEKEAFVRRTDAEARLRQLEVAARTFRDDRSRLPDTPETDVRALAIWADYAEGLRERERRVRSRLEALRPEVTEAVRTHVDARREVEGLRRLRERTLKRARRRRERSRQDLLDDVAARPFVPGGGNEFPPVSAEMSVWPGPAPTETTDQGKLGPKRGTEA